MISVRSFPTPKYSSAGCSSTPIPATPRIASPVPRGASGASHDTGQGSDPRGCRFGPGIGNPIPVQRISDLQKQSQQSFWQPLRVLKNQKRGTRFKSGAT